MKGLVGVTGFEPARPIRPEHKIPQLMNRPALAWGFSEFERNLPVRLMYALFFGSGAQGV